LAGSSRTWHVRAYDDHWCGPDECVSTVRPGHLYQDPDGKPLYSLEPKQTPDGRPYRAVLASEDISFDLKAATASPGLAGGRRILFYRNPMGLPDTSPAPKKDWMGMDYIPVYEGEEEDGGKTVKVSLDKVQRSGVRTEAVEARVIVRPVRAVGTVMHDESRLTIVTMRSDGYIEELFVNKTGQHVHAGDPLFRVYSPEIISAQIDLRVAGGAEQRLRNLGVPESHIREVRHVERLCLVHGLLPLPVGPCSRLNNAAPLVQLHYKPSSLLRAAPPLYSASVL
jgi:membrane fusion protein, copper/silver efflux system